mmetsp:Transcript_49977/g.159848  ORF Transcript_49977/g.159848 Transcript_49977/m.159848 type:complete len:201 (+) Transcript_49977:1187-1789(+)
MHGCSESWRSGTRSSSRCRSAAVTSCRRPAGSSSSPGRARSRRRPPCVRATGTASAASPKWRPSSVPRALPPPGGSASAAAGQRSHRSMAAAATPRHRQPSGRGAARRPWGVGRRAPLRLPWHCSPTSWHVCTRRSWPWIRSCCAWRRTAVCCRTHNRPWAWHLAWPSHLGSGPWPWRTTACCSVLGQRAQPACCRASGW